MGCVCPDGDLWDDDYRHGYGDTRGWLELEVYLVRSLQEHSLRYVRLIYTRMYWMWILATVTFVFLNIEKTKTFIM